MSLPWLGPALLRPGGAPATDPIGVELFAARADTPFGAVGSLLSLGGIWNAEVVPPGYDSAVTAVGRLVISCAALLAFGHLLLRRAGVGSGSGLGPGSGPGTGRESAVPERDARACAGLAMAAAAGFALACVGLTGPGRDLLQALIEFWPGFAALRDGQVFIAPLALAEAVGLGALAVVLARGEGGRALAAAALVAPVALLPGVAWGMGGRLDAVPYPADWARARVLTARDPVPGAVLSLPWAAHRRVTWNGGRTLLDPAPRLLSRRVVWNDGLRVGGPSPSGGAGPAPSGGARGTVPEDPKAREAERLLAAPGPRTAALAAAGYRYVVVARTTALTGEDTIGTRLPGAVRVLSGGQLTVYRIPRPDPFREAAPPTWTPVTCGLITLLLTLWSFGASGPSLVAPRHTR
jgi:hypothetical protein